MVQVNLLPWREALRNHNRKTFLTGVLVSILVALIVIVLIYLLLAQQTNAQRNRNTLLQNEVDQLSAKIHTVISVSQKKRQLETNLTVLLKLQHDRYEAVRLLNEITKMLPDGIYLNEIQREGNIVTLMGQAQSNLLISQLMEKIENSLNVTTPKLSDVTTVRSGGQSITNFKLTLSLIPPKVQLYTPQEEA